MSIFKDRFTVCMVYKICLENCFKVCYDCFCLLIKVAKYLLDCSTALDEESLYEASLRIEPKTSS